MSTSSKYFDLTLEIQRIEYRIHFLKEDNVTGEEYGNAAKELEVSKSEYANFEATLKENNSHADEVRIGMIAVANSLIEQFERYRKYPFMYPDLNQGMIVPGYLIGKILHSFKDVVIFDGSYSSISIYPSKYEWNFDKLENLVIEIREELQDMQFLNFMEGIKYYETIHDRTSPIINELRENRII
ncbi:hypothetical protein G6M26_43180 [Agrobacterium tumefaciens]|nr:hypothetical protein [Agrobacterium tumefaciens]NTE25350.1 hypothetical protein [Agrobacterium tumefaciens]